MNNAVMIQGTASDVGKSLVVAGLCRAARRRGLSVAPFKPQNLSNNAAVTADGGEIGRAQALQAVAAGLAPHTDMNPVLLKPEADAGLQVIVHGRRRTGAALADRERSTAELLAAVMESFERLRASHDLVVVEGAGSPAEINLRARDIANMGFATRAEVPVVLVGDIERGGVIAQLVGTHAVLEPEDLELVRGFIVNKFRGDPRLFDEGHDAIALRTGWRGLGVLPWYEDAWRLPSEDAIDPGKMARGAGFHVVCLELSRISNVDDLDPLASEPGVRLTMLGPGRPVPADADLVLIPGTKSTRGDLAFLRAQGWDVDIAAHHRRGGAILGICGGYQMLGRVVADPEGIEGAPGETEGLGLLDVTTTMTPEKRLAETWAEHVATGARFQGYEIHVGRTTGPDVARPFARVSGEPEGAVSADGLVAGSYFHGMFREDAFRRAWLSERGVTPAACGYGAAVESTLDGLADHLEEHCDVDGILALARS